MKMRKTAVVVLLVLLAAASVAVADAEADVNEVIEEIMRDHNVDRITQVDPDAVSDDRLAELGEALMDDMVPNQRQHDFMDRMMGGTGSESLQAMHQSMGYQYLAQDGRVDWGPGRGGWGMMGGPGMMGGWGGQMWSGWSLVFWGVIVVLLVAVIVLAILLATRGRSGKK